MRPTLLVAIFAALILATACSKPEFYEMQPGSVSFETRGTARAVRAVAKNRRGQVFPKDGPTRWSSSDEAVVTVDDEGLVTAVGPGRAQIIATRGELRGEVMAEVDTVEKLEVDPLIIELVEDGNPIRPKVRILDARGREMRGRTLVARCADEKICTMDRSNQIWPHEPGETTAEFVCDDRKETVQVTVKRGRRR